MIEFNLLKKISTRYLLLLHYEVEYSDGDLEQITDEPDSAQLLQELHLAILDAKPKQMKRKLPDSKIAATVSRKRKKMV
jgi:hypothetical protein